MANTKERPNLKLVCSTGMRGVSVNNFSVQEHSSSKKWRVLNVSVIAVRDKKL